MRLLAALLVLGSLVLAGCVDPPAAVTETEGAAPPSLSREDVDRLLSKPVFKEMERLEAVVPGADGTKTWIDVFLPKGAGKVPVILVMTPYRSLGDALAPLGGCVRDCPYDADLVEFFVPRGYAVAFSDVRGNHNSGGCVDQTGPKQWEDGYNVIEWLGTQEWSNGKVGMHGISYDGETQVSTARLNPPHLVTLVPAATVSNQYEYVYYDGVPYEAQGASTMGAYLAISLVPGAHPNAVTTYPERLACQPENFRNAMDLSGDWNAYWQERDYRVGAEAINASVLQIHGLGDWNVKPNHVDGFWNNLTSTKRLILGQWGHAFPDRDDWEHVLHRWYDHFLLGVDTGILQDLPPVLIEDDEGDWRGIGSFPPLDARTLTLNLTPEGALTPDAAPEGALRVRDLPRDGLGGPDDPPFATLASAAGIPHRLVFESDPMTEDVRLTGRPTLRLSASTDARSTHWVVHLVEIGPDGQGTILNRGYLDTRHRAGLSNPADLAPGEEYEATVRLFPQDDVVQKGNRLRLVLTNDDDWVHQDPTQATSTVLFGPGRTALLLPTGADGTPVPEDRLRDGL